MFISGKGVPRILRLEPFDRSERRAHVLACHLQYWMNLEHMRRVGRSRTGEARPGIAALIVLLVTAMFRPNAPNTSNGYARVRSFDAPNGRYGGWSVLCVLDFRYGRQAYVGRSSGDMHVTIFVGGI